MRQIIPLILSTLIFLLLGTDAYTQGLVIVDCQGFTRAVHQAQGSELNNVQIHVADSTGAATNGTPVQLTNNLIGEVFTAQTHSGMAAFNALPVGNYSMAVTGTNLSVGTITVGSTGLGVVASTGVVAGGVAAGGGAVAGSVAVVDQVENQINGDTPEEPTPTPEPTTAPAPGPTLSPTPIPEPTATPCDCVPDAEPTPLDNFFDDPQSNVSRRAAPVSPFH